MHIISYSIDENIQGKNLVVSDKLVEHKKHKCIFVKTNNERVRVTLLAILHLIKYFFRNQIN